MQVVELSMRNGTLIAGRQTGPFVTPVADDRFIVAGQPGELVFASGEHAGFERRVGTTHPVPFEWRQPVTLTKATLASYAGTYRSDELAGATYRVTAKDSTLEFVTGTSQPFSARPIFTNAFIGNGYTIQFTDAKGRVSGFEVTDGRMRRVRFARVP